MSVNKKNRSLWGSRSEAQRIYYQRQTIKRLEEKIEQLKEQKKELRSWLEEMLDNESDIFSVVRVKDVLSKLNELESGKNG